MQHSSIPTIFEFEEEESFVAACDCGWQTEVHDSKQDAIDEFEQVHLLANPRDEEDEYDSGSYDGCWFCGQVGHFQATCPHKPVYKVK